jgi:predicted glutamine amidotransferase
MADALRRAIRRVIALVSRHAPDEHIYLNAVLTDGNAAVACRYTTDRQENADTLYTNSGRRYICDDGVCRMLDPGEQNGSAVMVSSEPLSSDTGWSPVAINHLIRIEPNLTLIGEPVGV